MIIDTDSQLKGDRRPGISKRLKRSAPGGSLRARIKRGVAKLRWWKHRGRDLKKDERPPPEISALEDDTQGRLRQ